MITEREQIRTRICSRRRTSEAARGSAQVDDCTLYNLGTAAVSSTPPARVVQRSYVIEQARLLRQKNENRYLAVLVAARGVNRCRKALFGASSRPDTPTAVLGGETVEH